MSADHDLELSERAMYHPMTRSSVAAIRTTTPRARRMPSTNTTRWTSPVLGAIGQMDQNRAHLRLKVLPPPGMSRCLAPDISQARNDARSFAVLSILLVNVAPQPRHRQRCEPDPVFPNFLVASPQ